MIVNGWHLYQYKLFTHELDALIAEVKRLQKSQPDTYKSHPKTKRLAKIRDLMLNEIPADPAHDRFNQGNTLGTEQRLWKRAKFGQNRFRLFFRYDGPKKVIIYAWVNNENTLRKEGEKNDPYAIFAKGLKRGDPPADLTALLKLCTEVQPDETPPEEPAPERV
jgi:toxin YhaV